MSTSKTSKFVYDYNSVPKCIKNMLQRYNLKDDELRIIKALLENEITRGLAKKTHKKARVKCFVTYVQDLPNGFEEGKFLALDLGGTNFRVLMIELEGEEEVIKNKVYEVPKDKVTGTGKALFDHIAACLADFIKENKLEGKKLPLGFTFSFPVKQIGLTKGILERWTKGFDCSGVEGQDVVEFLSKSIAERGDIKIEVCAILNDTTGTLMSCAWKDHDTFIGLIVGTGSNACYVEKVKRAEMFVGESDKPYVIINTEWGAFGDDGILDLFRTNHDLTIDQTSSNPGKQIFEKMVAGMYMGELARLLLLELAEHGLFLTQTKGAFGKLQETGGFPTRYVSLAETDDTDVEYGNIKRVLEELDIDKKLATKADYMTLRYVCDTVSNRAADLCSAGICALLEKMGRKKVTVAVDGTVYKKHPNFATRMQETVDRLCPDYCKTTLKVSDDGSGLGAALVAAVAHREYHGSLDRLKVTKSQMSGITTYTEAVFAPKEERSIDDLPIKSNLAPHNQDQKGSISSDQKGKKSSKEVKLL